MKSFQAKWISSFFCGPLQNVEKLAVADGAETRGSNPPQRILLRANTAFDEMRLSQEAADFTVQRPGLLRCQMRGAIFGNGEIPIAGIALGQLLGLPLGHATTLLRHERRPNATIRPL